jgi:hypothetical protein
MYEAIGLSREAWLATSVASRPTGCSELFQIAKRFMVGLVGFESLESHFRPLPFV